jgi:hypothetical protein
MPEYVNDLKGQEDEVVPSKKDKPKKHMDINEAHYKFGHLGEDVLQRSMAYHGYHVIGKLNHVMLVPYIKQNSALFPRLPPFKHLKQGNVCTWTRQDHSLIH